MLFGIVPYIFFIKKYNLTNDADKVMRRDLRNEIQL